MVEPDNLAEVTFMDVDPESEVLVFIDSNPLSSSILLPEAKELGRRPLEVLHIKG